MDEVGIRAFFAVGLHGAPRRRAEALLSRLRSLPGADAVRWVRPEGLHVTLRFLGDIAASQVEPLLRHAVANTRALAPFPLVTGDVVPFPSARRPRVVALRVGPEAPLGLLAEALERSTVEAGLAPETRGFRPHVTLGRVRRGARLPQDFSAGMTGPDTDGGDAALVTEATLFRSDLQRGGSIYTSIGRVPLNRRSTLTPESKPTKDR